MGILQSELRLLSQTEAANVIGVQRGLLSMWKREGWLRPTFDVPRDRTTQGREMKCYSHNDVVAGLFRKTTRDYFTGTELTAMTELVQRSDTDELKHSEFVWWTSEFSMMRHTWISDIRLRFDGEPRDEKNYKSGYAWLESLGERMKNRVQLEEFVEAIAYEAKNRGLMATQ